MPNLAHNRLLPPFGFMRDVHFTIMASHCAPGTIDARPGVTLYAQSNEKTKEIYPHDWQMSYMVNLTSPDDPGQDEPNIMEAHAEAYESSESEDEEKEGEDEEGADRGHRGGWGRKWKERKRVEAEAGEEEEAEEEGEGDEEEEDEDEEPGPDSLEEVCPACSPQACCSALCNP
jgi:hypothetical protein